mgnify:CR=1 FL=1
MNPWTMGGNWSSGATAGLGYTDVRYGVSSASKDIERIMRENLAHSYRLTDIRKNNINRGSNNE